MRSTRKLLTRLSYAVVSPLAVGLVVFAVAARPWLKVQFFLIPFRFGTSLGYAVHDIRERESLLTAKVQRRLYIASPENASANLPLLRWLAPLARWTLVPRTLMVPVVMICRQIPRLSTLIRPSPSARELHDMHHQGFGLTLPAELAEIADALESQPCSLGKKPRVALLVRDREATYRELGAAHANKNEFRNAEINSYQQAIGAMVSRGYFVVRVGHRARPMGRKMSGFFDYTQSDLRSPKLDIALPRLFSAMVTSSSGLDSLYHLLGVPLIGVNVPWIDASYRHLRLILPKHLCLQSEPQTEIPIIELMSADADLCSMPTVRGERVIFKDASPDEIEEAVRTALDILEDPNKSHALTIQCEPLWREFWNRGRKNGVKMHSFQYETEPTILIPASVQRRFLSV